MTGTSERAVHAASSREDSRGVRPRPEGRARHATVPALALLVAAAGTALAIAGCTTVNTATVKERRDAGISRDYDRPPAELFQASVLALENLRSDPNWRDLRIVEKDPATGTVIAERDLDSAVIPGLGERDAIGIFVADLQGGDSRVTVVRLSSDQFPGDAGTTVNTARDASGLLFPAIDDALATVPEGPRPAVVAAPAAAPAPPAPATAPSSASAAAAAPRSETALDRAYALLRDGGTWRPLTREVAADGSEQLRVGSFAVLTASGERLTLAVKNKSSAVDAARLALALQNAGFTVDVVEAGGR
jgi:hypothetical protein